jgi:hypothetical protein
MFHNIGPKTVVIKLDYKIKIYNVTSEAAYSLKDLEE